MKNGMFHFPALAFLALLLLALANFGCAKRHVLITKDYAVHIAEDTPHVDGATDTVTYEDSTGTKISVPRSDLKVIRQLDD